MSSHMRSVFGFSTCGVVLEREGNVQDIGWSEPHRNDIQDVVNVVFRTKNVLPPNSSHCGSENHFVSI